MGDDTRDAPRRADCQILQVRKTGIMTTLTFLAFAVLLGCFIVVPAAAVVYTVRGPAPQPVPIPVDGRTNLEPILQRQSGGSQPRSRRKVLTVI